jgi:ADP-ribose pyrophosphatase YjhB (NUDIX family)
MDIQLVVRVRGVLRNQEGILFCYNKKQNFYFLPGGSLELGEDAKQCLQREFQEECQLEIIVGSFKGCLECHWQEDEKRYQELDLIFEVCTQVGSIPKFIPSLESHISFSFLPLQAVLDGFYKILPAACDEEHIMGYSDRLLCIPGIQSICCRDGIARLVGVVEETGQEYSPYLEGL